MRIEPPVPPDVLAAIRAPLLAGARPVDAPLLQPLGLILDLAGEAMRARLFVVQAESGEEMCLRPDFTVAVARGHIEGAAAVGRYAYEGSAFRASAGGDRAEEFLQVGLEAFQASSADPVVEDVEIARIAWQASLAGGRDDLTLWLGDVALFAAFIDSLALPDALAARLRRAAASPRRLQAELARVGRTEPPGSDSRLAAALAGRSEEDAAGMLEELWALAGITPVGGRGAREIAQRLIRRAEAASAPALTASQAAAIGDFMAINDSPAVALGAVERLAGSAVAGLGAALAAWADRLGRLSKDIPLKAMRFAPALGHAFDYYDGLTFEVRSAALGSSQAVAVGGRYDGLLARLGASAGGRAVGCMVRPWRAWSGGGA